MDMRIKRLLLKLLILISFVPKNYGGIVSFGPAEGTVVALESILKLTCEISGFANNTNAVLKRNGTTINSCTNDDFCNIGPTYNISNAVFTFKGEANRVILTINPLLVGEVGIDYECNYNSVSEVYTIKLSKSEESSSVDPLTIVGGVVGGVVGVGAVSSLAVGGSMLLKKQASDKNDRTVVPGADDVEGGNAVADSSADKPDTNGRTVVADADDAKGGGAAAAESSTVKSDKDASNVEQKDNHTDDKKHKETAGEAAVTEEQITLFAENTA